MDTIVDINVYPTVEEVTIIATPTNYIVNVNKVTGGGGNQNLADTLDIGNTTEGNDIILNNEDTFFLENGSSLKKGNYDFGAQGGISRICGVGFEDMWQSGIRHVFDGNGLIRNSTNCFNIIPDVSFDSTLRFKIGSIWTLDDGTNYICTDATTASAVWELYNVIPDTSNLVPYTGATQDVNLGEFGLQTGNIEFDLTPTNAPTAVGSMVWNDTAGTLDLKLKGGAVTLQIGQETVARVVNKTATNITLLESNYQAVRVTGAQGQRPKVDLAQGNNDLNSTTTLGLVTETILNNQEGFITTSGQVQQINTTGSLQGETWTDGDVLYLSGTVAGRITNIKPIAPIHTVIIGFVEYAHINQGKIFVKVDNGYELDELHNVSAATPNNNEALVYDTPTLLWKPKALTTADIADSTGKRYQTENQNSFNDATSSIQAQLNIVKKRTAVFNNRSTWTFPTNVSPNPFVFVGSANYELAVANSNTANSDPLLALSLLAIQPIGIAPFDCIIKSFVIDSRSNGISYFSFPLRVVIGSNLVPQNLTTNIVVTNIQVCEDFQVLTPVNGTLYNYKNTTGGITIPKGHGIIPLIAFQRANYGGGVLNTFTIQIEIEEVI